MNYVILICCLLKSYRYLQILQLEHYDVNKYLKYIKNNYIYYNLIPLVFLLCFKFIDSDIINVICLFSLFVYLSMATIVSIVRMKFTKKIIRIYCLLLLVLPLIFLNVNIIYFLLFEFIILIPYYLNKPVDNYINKKYLIQSESKYDKFTGYKIGITGSYGKTSTKNIINNLLQNYLVGSCSYKSYNTLLGISKYINDIPLDAYEYVVLEYGASRLGDIEELTNSFSPDIACITEIGYMHLDTFKSIRNIITEKMSILNNAKVAILNYEQIFIREYHVDIPVISYGFNYGDYRANNICVKVDGASFDLYYKGKYIDTIYTNLIGRHQILNLLCGICVLHYLEIDIKESVKYMNSLSNTESRLVLKKYQKYQILDDSYNANLVGSINALEILNNIDTKKILITPGYVENSEVEYELYKKLSSKIEEVNPFVILVGDKQTKILQELLEVEYMVVNSFKEAMSYVNSLEDYYTILIENDLPDNYKG